ncbi:coiled-coil domain-containing protein SCD2 isoform X2 [Cryptomeria japonica]|uniref:coiled-coil domain-containing protein SCD2 isoform X2 n=1 Tax=Cryptomeria japonica TaxID=3369 RepID=UPI0025AB6489|nr:coiled-coil domain-containing protein SCD2 isoform X2 [Cryptomeria japonica]
MDRHSRKKTVHSNGKEISSPVKKSEKSNAAKAAAQRLAHVMASQSPSRNGDGRHILPSRSASPSANKGYVKSTANTQARIARSLSPAVRKNMNGHTSTPSTSTVRMYTSPQQSPKAITNGASEKQIPPSPRAQSNAASVKQITPSPRAQSPNPRQQSSAASVKHISPSPRAQSPSPRAQSSTASVKQIPPSPRAQSPSPRAQSNAESLKQIPPSPGALSPSSRAQSIAASLKQRPPKPPLQAIDDVQNEKRYSAHFRHVKFRESDKLREVSTLHDEVDLLKEEKEKLLYKIQLAEQKFKEQEVRARECEKQVALFGESLSLDADLLSKKEKALQQREDALKAEKRAINDKDDRITVLRLKVETVKGEALESVQQAQEVEAEANLLWLMMQRMILTQEEMEEVVLKRCWLARYWGLAFHHGIYSEIAGERHEYWSSLAPLPLEVVMSAGFKVKEEHVNGINTLEDGNNRVKEKGRVACTPSDLNGDRNIENMLFVEKGLNELASLKVEDAIGTAIAQHRQLNHVRVDELFRDTKPLASTPKFEECRDLTQEEVEDIQFKQAWLIYFWRRAKTHKVVDIAGERLQYWISRNNQSPTSRDVVDVQRGLMELRKLGIEDRLWEASRNEIP